MTVRSLVAAMTLTLVGQALPTTALAHASIISSTPEQGATVAGPRSITMTFSAPVQPQTTAASIVMTAMPGVEDHGEMVIRNFTPTWSDDNRTLTLNIRQPLRSGTYEVRWQSTGADGHRVNGTLGFVVR